MGLTIRPIHKPPVEPIATYGPHYKTYAQASQVVDSNRMPSDILVKTLELEVHEPRRMYLFDTLLGTR